MLKACTTVLQKVNKTKKNCQRLYQFLETGCGQAKIHHLIITQKEGFLSIQILRPLKSYDSKLES